MVTTHRWGWLVLVGLLSCPASPTDRAKGRWTAVLDHAFVRDARVRAAMEKVRRADYLPDDQRRFELDDRPLPIGYGQTTSQPSLIAQMVEAMALEPGCRVLEVGTGSGYQTALLAELCDQVYSIDIVVPLAERAAADLAAHGYRNAHVKAGDGYLGWPEVAPFDAVVVCAAAPRVPPPLFEQLKPGGRLVIPVGEEREGELLVVTRLLDGGAHTRSLVPVMFVPLTGERAARDRDGGW